MYDEMYDEMEMFNVNARARFLHKIIVISNLAHDAL